MPKELSPAEQALREAARQSLDTYRLLYRKQRERMVEGFAVQNQLALLERLKNPATAKAARIMPIEAPLLPEPGIPAGDAAEQPSEGALLRCGEAAAHRALEAMLLGVRSSCTG